MASDTLDPVRRERTESGGDLLASLTKEAQHLKAKLEEEKRKLYDADCMSIFIIPSLGKISIVCV